MKYFHISLAFRIKNKPTWLDNFRKEYDKPYPYHITLKDETEVEESDIEKLKEKIGEIIKKYNSKELAMTFDAIRVNETSKGHCIMISTKQDIDIRKLQAEIKKEMEFFGKACSVEHAKFENNFNPHITIGRHLSDKGLLQAKKELPTKINFEIEPEKIVLSIINKLEIKERLKEENRNYLYF